MRKISFALMLVCTAFFMVQCGDSNESNTSSSSTSSSTTSSSEEAVAEVQEEEGIDAKGLYKMYCIACHGEYGNLGVNGSKDLTVSELTKEEKVAIITKGKALMTGFEGILSTEEIEAVADYVGELKKE